MMKATHLSAKLSVRELLDILFIALLATFMLVEQEMLMKAAFYTMLVTALHPLWKQKPWQQSEARSFYYVIGIYLCYQFISYGWNDGFSWGEAANQLRKALLVLAFISILALIYAGQKSALFWRALISFALFSALLSSYLYLADIRPAGRMIGIGQGENPIQSALLYGLAWIASAYFLLSKSTLNKKDTGLCIIAWAGLLFAMILTESRGALLGGMVAHGYLFWIFCQQPKIRWGAIVLGIAIIAASSTFIDWQDWLQRADGFRFEIWADALSQIGQTWQKMAFGEGFRSDFESTVTNGQILYQPHSIYVSALYYGGILGLLALIAVFGFSFKSVYIAAKYHQEAHLACALLVNAMVVGCFDFDILLTSIKLEWLVFWLPIGAGMGYAVATKKDKYPI